MFLCLLLSFFHHFIFFCCLFSSRVSSMFLCLLCVHFTSTIALHCAHFSLHFFHSYSESGVHLCVVSVAFALYTYIDLRLHQHLLNLISIYICAERSVTMPRLVLLLPLSARQSFCFAKINLFYSLITHGKMGLKINLYTNLARCDYDIAIHFLWTQQQNKQTKTTAHEIKTLNIER